MPTAHSLLTAEFERKKADAERNGARYRHADFARWLGVSETTLGCWLGEKYAPSLALARRVEINTRGQIRAARLLGLDNDGTVPTDTPST